MAQARLLQLSMQQVTEVVMEIVGVVVKLTHIVHVMGTGKVEVRELRTRDSFALTQCQILLQRVGYWRLGVVSRPITDHI